MPYGPPDIFVPSRRPLDPATLTRWRAARCDEVVRPAIRVALWSFVRETAPLLHPGAEVDAGPARLSGLNDPRVTGAGPGDHRGSDVKVGMLGTDGAQVCLVLRAQPAATGPAARRHWRDTLGAQGIRPGATAVTGIDQVDPDEVVPLLPEPPSEHVRPWIVVRATPATRTGWLAVDAGDGRPRRVIDFAVLRLDRPGPVEERPARCPHCTHPRVRRYAAFDLCPDCGWFAQP
ncbi:hypothetical protein [Actinoplanes sp. N902-109]|uniref:hypothetical protein n=1 Tax=Actinoplanes sp. (strain N902-109) TaxID=649831 RepID=UPI0012F7733C|nr:hypothetical protein [Actinoplanes sp. N902-109]